MTALLTDNLPLLAGAPNGIKKLRELILELAVRGKLVPQDPSDEPASELLKRIAEEKAQLVAGTREKKQKAFAEISAEEKPYTLPSGWEFARLGDLVDPRRTITYGVLKPGGNTTDGVPLIKAENVQFNLILTEFKSRISAELDEEYKRTRLQGGEVLLTLVGSIGRCAIAPIELVGANLSRSVGMIVPLSGVDKRFMVYAMTSLIDEAFILKNCAGTAQKVLNVGTVNDMPYPLPPIAEQHRIVAKVDELMALCDRLEARQADADNAHAQLVQVLLDSLTQARDAEDFAQSWQRLAEHFHTLFTTESSIDALKQTLLQLAVMGKLVPQDPNDEPASELLKRIAEQKARLVEKGEIKKQKPMAAIAEEEKPYDLPDSWAWVRLPEIYYSVSVSGNKLLSSQISEEGIFPVVDQGKKFVSGFTDDESLLIRLPGPVVVFGDHTTERKYVDFDFVAGADGVKILRPVLLDEKFFWWHLVGLKLEGRGYARHFKVLNDAFFALPPKGEQSRIVAKVDQLMALCDQLKARLNQARQVHEQLAGALVEQAVA